jgi:hypothetical protein
LLNTVLGSLSSGVAASTSSYESIATGTGTGLSATISFTSIPSTYKHLQIRGIAKDTFANSNVFGMYVTFNSDTGSNYASHRLGGSSSAIYATGYASQTSIELRSYSVGNSATNIMGVSIMDIQNYTNTSQNKTLRAFGGVDKNGTGNIELCSGLWQNTSAITRIDLVTSGTLWSSSTTFALYGIKG